MCAVADPGLTQARPSNHVVRGPDCFVCTQHRCGGDQSRLTVIWTLGQIASLGVPTVAVRRGLDDHTRVCVTHLNQPIWIRIKIGVLTVCSGSDTTPCVDVVTVWLGQWVGLMCVCV
jgi:hypothetical protein